MTQELAAHCIYTIVHRDSLAEKAQHNGPADFEESRAWVTGEQLWQEAQTAKKAMPVLFGDAAYSDELLHWGLLTLVRVKGESTTYTVDRLRAFKPGHHPQELVLRSTSQNIAPNFIRPYAICLTPPFLEE